MLKAKIDLTSRKKTLKTLKENELDALHSGHVKEIEKFNKLKNYFTVMSSAETNCKNVKNVIRTTFLKWRTNALTKSKNI
jgi:glycerol-3-phosphate cytidylyltransferase-like family protein